VNNIYDIAKPWIKNLAVYEPGKPIEETARELGFDDPSEIIKLASNENSLGPSPLAARAMRKAISSMHRYPDGDAFYLSRKLAAKLNIKPDQLAFGTGSNEIIDLLCRIFLDENSSIVASERAFVIYRIIAASFKARTIQAPMKGFTHDPDAMLAAIEPSTRLVFFANPNNPTGTIVDGPALDRFMDKVPPHVMTVLDEAYIELLPPKKRPDSLRYVRENRNVIVLRTFSKTYGLAGLRLGYGIAPKECISLINRVRQPFNVNAMAQAAAIAALDDGKFVDKTCATIARGLAYFERELTASGIKFVPSVANFMLVEVGSGRNIFEAMLREKVIVRPMDVYGLPSHVRITVGTLGENRRCVKALRKVLAAAV